MTPSSNAPSEKPRRWCVETRVTVIRHYYVVAENEKMAEAASCEATSDFEEDENEETLSITEIAS